jgi:hypothetical protein
VSDSAAPVWSDEAAAAYAASPESAEGIHDEDTTPDPSQGETRVFFTRSKLAPDRSCPWCVIGNCWQKVTQYGPADGARVVHGRRVV